jgi:GT2 family glycosyltransferase
MIAAIIPTRFRPPQLEPLLELLAADGVEAYVMDSADYGHRIYRMWNAGVAIASDAGLVAVLNDDITILPGTLPLMAEALADPAIGIVYPDVRADLSSGLPSRPIRLEATTGSWGAGGMTGFCFMFRSPAFWPVFDEAYSWWYGDDDFEERVRGAGRAVARVVGLPIGHAANGSAGRVMDELGPLIVADRTLWDSRHAAVPA